MILLGFDGTVYGQRIFTYLVTKKEIGRQTIAFHIPDIYVVTRNGLILLDGLDMIRRTDTYFQIPFEEGDFIEVIQSIRRSGN